MEPSKKGERSKSWLKRLTRYKINSSHSKSLTSSNEDIESSADRVIQSAARSNDVSSTSCKNNSHSLFGSLRRVHSRVKLCVSKRKVRMLDSRSSVSAFVSENSVDIPQRNQIAASSTSEVNLFVNLAVDNVYSPNPVQQNQNRSTLGHTTRDTISVLNDATENTTHESTATSTSVSTNEPLYLHIIGSDEKPGSVPTKEITNLATCCWYWGPLSRKEAEQKLCNLPDGSFLIRDSSSDIYLFSISFRSIGHTLHTHIEHVTGNYSLFNQHGFSTIAELIDHAIEKSQNSVYCYTKPHSNLLPAFPVRLTRPVSRFTQVRSLQYLCRFVIRQFTNINNISSLPIPASLQNYLKQGHY